MGIDADFLTWLLNIDYYNYRDAQYYLKKGNRAVRIPKTKFPNARTASVNEKFSRLVGWVVEDGS